MSNAEERQRVYLAFQGGGAKGIAHVGGLAAVNELSLEIAGVAGTSAGAIVAALIAAKYPARDIFDGLNRTHLLQRVAEGKYRRPIDLFTSAGWGEISKLIRTKFRIMELAATLDKQPKWRRWAICVTGLAVAASAIWMAPPTSLFALIVAVCYIGRRLHRIYKGLAPLTEVRTVIDAALSETLGAGKINVTFADLDASGGLPLKLVATNLTDQTLELFSLETTPDVAIADAVAASIRLPFIFEQWTVPIKRVHENASANRSFLDGGLVSNLPVWSFDEERGLDPSAVTIAFGLKPSQQSNPEPKHWVLAAIDAVVAGPPQIHMRGIDRLVYVPLDCSLDILAFDASFDDYRAEVMRAQQKTRLILDRELTEIPALVSQALEQMRTSIWNDLHTMNGWGEPGNGTWPRIALAVQRPGDRLSMTVVYQVGHRPTTNRLRIALDHPTVGAAWSQRISDEPFLDVYLKYRGFGETDDLFGDSQWRAAVPVSVIDPKADEQASAAQAVVAIIDSPHAIDMNDVDLNAFAANIRQLALEFFKTADFGRLARRSVSWL